MVVIPHLSLSTLLIIGNVPDIYKILVNAIEQSQMIIEFMLSVDMEISMFSWYYKSFINLSIQQNRNLAARWK